MTAFEVYVISAGRPHSVAAMAPFLADLPHTWITPGADRYAYAAAGAPRVLVDAPPADPNPLVSARNLALEMARIGDAWCVQISDDLRRLTRLAPSGPEPSSLAAAIPEMIDAALRHGARLAGCTPTANVGWASRRVATSRFIVGDLFAVSPSSPLRFDPALRLKEDYDFTLAHLRQYGVVARCDWLIPDFAHRTNPGGAVAYRSPALEQEAIAHLQAKHPGCLVPNPRRANEVLLRWPPKAR